MDEQAVADEGERVVERERDEIDDGMSQKGAVVMVAFLGSLGVGRQQRQATMEAAMTMPAAIR